MRSTTGRSALLLLVAHVAIIAFSTVAMVTILAGPPGPWLAEEPAATVMRLSYRLAGPSYVVIGTLACLVYLTERVGWRRTVTVGLSATAISLGAELLGTSTGLPFGDYAYSGLLGYRILGRVPFPIPLSWFYMLVGALCIVARLRPVDDAPRGRWTWAFLAALLMLAWDVSMDPAMVATGHWLWGTGALFHDAGLPAWLDAFFTRDVFYGMPLANWGGWLLTATVVARVMLAILPPSTIASRVATSPLPVVLYAVNGIMPVALCIREGFWWAAGAGAVAMALPALVAIARRSRALAPTSLPDPA